MPSIIQKKSYDSVQIFWLNKDLIKERLDQSIEALVKSSPEIEKVVLFGSFAAGKETIGSDLDILIVVKSCREKFIDRSLKYQNYFKGIGLDTDVFVYAKDELREGVKIAETALKNGKILYDSTKK